VSGVSDQEVKDAQDRSSRDPVRRVLFTGGSVVTMDPAIGDLSKGDVIVDGSRIVDVGSDLCSLGAADDGSSSMRRGARECQKVRTNLRPFLIESHCQHEASY
jgi:hypothetical protein